MVFERMEAQLKAIEVVEDSWQQLLVALTERTNAEAEKVKLLTA